MRFCYLRIALLTSAFAANAFADAADTDVKLVASRTTSSPTFSRDDSAASAVTEQQNLTRTDVENRGGISVWDFSNLIGRPSNLRGRKGISVEHFDKILARKTITRPVYHDLSLDNPQGNILSDINWVRWAFFVCRLGHHFGENVYEFMLTAMSLIYDAEELSKILIIAAFVEKTKPLAINLARVADDYLKSRFLNEFPELTNQVFHQVQHTKEQISRNLRVEAYIGRNANSNVLPDKEFSILISYLSVLLSKDYAVSAELSISHECSEDAALLQTLLSLNNFHDPQCLGNLVSIWLDVTIPPSKIVSMLLKDNVEADHYTILFSNGPSRKFWLHYLEKYNAISREKFFTDYADANFNQLSQMLFTVVEQESPATNKQMAYTTILKMLISPSTADFSSNHENVMKLTSTLLIDRTLPSDVLSMLIRGEAYADRFRIFYLNQPSKSFWVRYLKLYNELSKDDEVYTHTANIDFQQLLMMLHDVEVQNLSIAERYLANSTILKILLSPEITDVITSQQYLETMTLNWLKQGLHPSVVVLMLVLEEVETTYFKILFTNKPSSKFWVNYMKTYYADTPSLQDHIMSTLTYVFGDANFERLLETALTDEATIEKAQFLLIHYNSWMLSLHNNL